MSHRLNGQRLVQLVGNRDGDEIHVRIVQNCLPGFVRVNANLLGSRVSLGLNIINAKQIDRIALLQIAGMPTAHATVTDDDAVSFGRYFIHGKISFSHSGKPCFCR